MAISPLISRFLLPFALKFLYASLRISVSAPKIQLPDKGSIVTFWHGKMVVGWLFSRNLFPDKKAAAVVSLSEDGRLLSDTLQQLGFFLIRGSSSKGGDEVLRSMQELINKESIVVLTPDGPRGPNQQFKYGTIRLASSNHYPLIFADIHFAKSWKLKSWDRFEIPKPFSRTTVTLHCIDLPEFRSEEELRAYTSELSNQLTHA